MADQRNNHNNHDDDHWSEEIMLARMDWLTVLAQKIMPRGFWKGKGEHIHLTFDDGPDPASTPWLLELLEKENIKATFFLMGSKAGRFPDLVEAIRKQGHAIGNHTFNHHFMPLLSIKKMEYEIEKTNQEIQSVLQKQPVLFRPPFGILDHRGADILKEREMTPVYWSVVPGDWAPIGEQRVVSRVMKRLAPGTVLVLHEGHHIAKQTVNAAREIIKRSKGSSWTFDVIR